MAKRRKRRGISFGTLMMLLLTCMVCIGCFTILPRLQGNTELHVDATQAEQVLREEVAAVCAQVLADAGVYKQDEAGLAGMKRFLATLGYQA